MYSTSFRASSNLMQWTYASLRSFTPYCPRFPRSPGRIGSCTSKKKTHPQVCLWLNQRLPILPGRLQPSTFGVYELNYCVRDGNRWTLIAIATESVRVCTLKTTQKLYIFVCTCLLNVLLYVASHTQVALLLQVGYAA